MVESSFEKQGYANYKNNAGQPLAVRFLCTLAYDPASKSTTLLFVFNESQPNRQLRMVHLADATAHQAIDQFLDTLNNLCVELYDAQPNSVTISGGRDWEFKSALL